jgi:hypothetical protein
MAKAPLKTETANTSDTAEARVVSIAMPPASPTPTPVTPGAQGMATPPVTPGAPAQDVAMGDALGPSLGSVTTPEAAMSALKAKTGILHTVINNVGHFGSLAFSDVEQLVADIAWLANYIRSKV